MRYHNYSVNSYVPASEILVIGLYFKIRLFVGNSQVLYISCYKLGHYTNSVTSLKLLVYFYNACIHRCSCTLFNG